MSKSRSDLSDEDRVFARRLKGSRTAARLTRLSLAKRSQVSEATIKFNETDRTKPSTTVYLLQLTKLDDDVVPTLLHEEPRVPVCAPAAPSRDGSASAPCQGGEPLCRSACDPLG